MMTKTMMTNTKDKLRKSPVDRLSLCALVIVGLLVMPTVVPAQESVPGLLYVIKVTPALVYLDGGASTVAMERGFSFFATAIGARACTTRWERPG